MKKFKDGDEYFLRHIVRAGVRKSAMTRCERDVTIVLLNLWLHHRNGPTKVIRPGRERVAKKSGSSVRTVASVMAKLRKAGVIKAVAYAKGGNNATRYTMDLIALMEFCGCVLPEAAPGELVRVPTENCTVQEPEIARLTHAAIAHGLKLTCEGTKPNIKHVEYPNGIVHDDEEGPFQEFGSWEDWLTRQGQILERENPKLRLITGGRA